MSTELTNLLPSERRAHLKRDYYLRLGALALASAGLLIIAHGALLAPSLAYVREQKAVQEARLAALSEKRAVSGFSDLSARIESFGQRAAALESLADAPAASDAVRAILDLSRRGIALTAFTFTAPQAGEGGRMTVCGSAATRESLRDFDQALGSLPFVEATDLPLSAYAKERDIPFSIALTLHYQTP